MPKNFTPQQKDFYRFVSRHVEDPSDYKIIEWGEKYPGLNGTFGRTVTFSCREIKKGVTKDTVSVEYGAGGIRHIVPDNGTGYW